MDVMNLVARISLDDSEYNRGLGKALKSVAKFGAAAIGAATTAATAFAGSAIKTGMEFDKSMSQVAATMGKTMDEMKNEVGSVDLAWGKFSGNLEEYAQEMGAHTAFSATQAADALNYMALAGYDTQTSMSMLPNVLNLAAAGNMELARASDMVTDTQTAFGISLDRTNQMVDEMAKAASTGNTSVEQLGDAFLVVGGLAQELNGGMVELGDGTQKPVDGLQELEIALVAMANAGVKGSEAGTHMRNMLLKLSSPTSEGTKQMEALGVSVFDAEGKMRSMKDIFGDLDGALGNLTQEQKIQAISDLFNTRDLASAEALLNAVGEDWDEIGESILDADGAAQKMADTQLDNLAGDITLFKSALEGAQIALSDGVEPALRSFVQTGTEGLSEFTEKLKEGDYAGAAKTIGETLGEELRVALSNIPSLATAGVSLLEGLFAGILGNIASENEMVATLATDTLKQSIAEKATSFIDSGAEMLGNLIDGIGSVGPRLIEVAGTLIGSLATSLGGNAPMLISKGIEMIGNLLIGIAQALPNIITGGINLITGLVQGISDGSGTLLEKIGEILLALGQAIYEAAPEMAAAMLNLIKALGNAFLETDWLAIGTKAFNGIVSAIQSIAPIVWNAVKSLVKNIISTLGFSGLGARVRSAFESARATITQKLNQARNTVSNVVSSIKQRLSFSGIAATVSGAFQGALQSVKDKMESAREAVSDAISRVKSILSGTISFPHVKIPHFSISGSFSLNPPSIPRIGVSWYKKAMEEPYLFKGATLIGAGEAGDEMLYGRSALLKDIREASGGGDNIVINLNYQAGDDANDMLKDIARGIQRYKMAGVI